MLTLLLLLSAQNALADFDAANLEMVQCYFEVVRGSSADAAAAELDRLMARTCGAEEAAFRKAARSRIRASGKPAFDLDGLILSVRSGIAEDAERWRGKQDKGDNR